MTAGSRVLGDGRVVVRTDLEVVDPQFPARLAELAGARAVVGLVGNLALLPGIDPGRDMPLDQKTLTHRRIDRPALEAQLDAVEDAARAAGLRWLPATAPLGRQGRIELPELVTVATWLRERDGPLLDLADRFARRERARLFADGLDTLDRSGVDELAAALFEALVDDELLPAGDPDAAAARLRQRALRAWRLRDPAFEALAREALALPAGDPEGQVQQAALDTALHGFTDDVKERWLALRGLPPHRTPGTAFAVALITEDPPFEAAANGLETVLMKATEQLVGAQSWRARATTERLVERFPHRTAAWLARCFMEHVVGGDVDPLRHRAVADLSVVQRPAIADALLSDLLLRTPRSIDAVPVLLAALEPWEHLRPTGFRLEQARREAALGKRRTALRTLRQIERAASLPPSWRFFREELEAEVEGAEPPR